jgi:hypothetical protein
MWTEHDALDYVGDSQSDHPWRSGFWLRVALKLAIVYLLVAWAYWEEVRFRVSGIRVEGRVVEMFDSGPQSRRLLVKYRFNDPETGAPRVNSAEIGQAVRPTAEIVAVDYIPGEYFHSRLAVQARPSAPWVFWSLNATLGTTFLVGLGYLIWEANHRPLTRQQRAVAAYRREKAKMARQHLSG